MTVRLTEPWTRDHHGDYYARAGKFSLSVLRRGVDVWEPWVSWLHGEQIRGTTQRHLGPAQKWCEQEAEQRQ